MAYDLTGVGLGNGCGWQGKGCMYLHVHILHIIREAVFLIILVIHFTSSI